MRALGLILVFLFAACEGSHDELVSPVHAAAQVGQAPTPAPAPTPALNVRVAQIINGNPGFSGPQDAWHVILEYDFTPDPLCPHLVVETYYQWGSVLRRNIKIWDCSAGRRVITDDFYDYAWAEPLIEYSVSIYAARVIDGDWFGGFCMGDPSDYFGTVDPSWLYCPIDGAHPNGLRVASGKVAAVSGLPGFSKLITVLGYFQVTVR